jgi:hypothetical protein
VVEVKLRIRTAEGGTGRIQWRTEGQMLFPPVQANSIKINWIKIGLVGADDEEHGRWDFQETVVPN